MTLAWPESITLSRPRTMIDWTAVSLWTPPLERLIDVLFDADAALRQRDRRALLTGEAFSFAFVAGGLVMLVGVYIGAFGHARPHRSTAMSLPECLPIADCRDGLAPPLVMTPRPAR